MAARFPSRRLYTHISSPVLASSATTDRRVPAVVYSTPLIISGVPSSLYSGRVPRLSVLKRHATSSLLKLDALIWSSGEYLVPFRSAVYCGHSPFLVEGCPAMAWPATPRDWPNASAANATAASRSLPASNVLSCIILLSPLACDETASGDHSTCSAQAKAGTEFDGLISPRLSSPPEWSWSWRSACL